MRTRSSSFGDGFVFGLDLSKDLGFDGIVFGLSVGLSDFDFPGTAGVGLCVRFSVFNLVGLSSGSSSNKDKVGGLLTLGNEVDVLVRDCAAGDFMAFICKYLRVFAIFIPTGLRVFSSFVSFFSFFSIVILAP